MSVVMTGADSMYNILSVAAHATNKVLCLQLVTIENP